MFRAFLYWLARHLCFAVLKIHNGLKVTGRELVPADRPVIVAANHVSNLDPVVVGCVFPGRLRPLGKEELFQINPFFTWLMNNLGVISVSRTTEKAAALALKKFLSLLKNGESLMIFPEGARSFDGRLKPLEGGVAVLATSVDAPVIPLYIEGTYEAMPVGSSKIKRNPITAHFGKPIMPLPKEQRGSLKEERERIRVTLQNELERMEKESIG
ncbi:MULTISPECIES: lysophospholipid acyltransferase family protein [unclassified Pyramidobacter]|uniref:lysophospholipid acyltransferase family protein n=1 Tax=unclassified Pyramidobacter TaxID=2632171 RepID=UPI00098F667C|nr:MULTISPECIES: lysophospholipid acyltransferase family protein [unclassified Pyramidobacter]MCI7404218.1 1-acyl-sn-glycerol-3-phosphate acyltransferase [Pyramidobacter sp.]MDY3212929.1 lysophospholipid acyltransferase family protein [Pyramidobacter sp.]OON88946.1 1-acyl-sn-glycerol-3-phosphate acyltransferase [Pyramidobacter sp. C12-8]RKJ80694.1 1-acyl-sn-glycerol-3-phosphate acyltransferase [Pyramidobacter sp. CG50-2]WOL41191.1 lysophospholipid acyltransferase family protein [Pyramidobacter